MAIYEAIFIRQKLLFSCLQEAYNYTIFKYVTNI